MSVCVCVCVGEGECVCMYVRGRVCVHVCMSIKGFLTCDLNDFKNILSVNFRSKSRSDPTPLFHFHSVLF